MNFLCSLLAYSLRTLTETAGEQGNNIVVIIECQKLTSKLLKLIMRASQNALAFKINHIIVLESDNFLEQQKISLDMALESYDFKVRKQVRALIVKIRLQFVHEPNCGSM